MKNKHLIIFGVILICCAIAFDIFIVSMIIKYYPEICTVLTSIIFIGFGFVLMLFSTLLLKLVCWITLPAPEVPAIEYYEFPFEVVYSIDDEVFEISDSIVYEYKGINMDDIVKQLKWDTYLKDAGTEYIELLDAGNGYSVCLYAGSPEYYMMECFPPYGDHVPGEYLHYSYNHRGEHLTAEEAKEKYGLEIISATFSEPIENELEYRTVDKIRLFFYDTLGFPTVIDVLNSINEQP